MFTVKGSLGDLRDISVRGFAAQLASVLNAADPNPDLEGCHWDLAIDWSFKKDAFAADVASNKPRRSKWPKFGVLRLVTSLKERQRCSFLEDDRKQLTVLEAFSCEYPKFRGDCSWQAALDANCDLPLGPADANPSQGAAH